MFFPALEADFQREYGLDLKAALWGPARMGVRRLAALTTGLPRDCAFHRAADPDGTGAGWTATEELLAVVAELLDRHDAHYVMAHSKKGTPKPKLLKIPRPSRLKAPRRNATGEELKALTTSLGGAVAPGKRG